MATKALLALNFPNYVTNAAEQVLLSQNKRKILNAALPTGGVPNLWSFFKIKTCNSSISGRRPVATAEAADVTLVEHG